MVSIAVISLERVAGLETQNLAMHRFDHVHVVMQAAIVAKTVTPVRATPREIPSALQLRQILVVHDGADELHTIRNPNRHESHFFWLLTPLSKGSGVRAEL